jgi:hypothetical protein
MIHLFRPHEPVNGASPPVGTWQGHRWADELRQLLAQLAQLTRSPRLRRLVHGLLLVVGIVVQGVMLLTIAYLCDLSISLMELWAELARKHLELTV